MFRLTLILNILLLSLALRPLSVVADVQEKAERYFQDPTFLQVKLSPSGEYLAIQTHHLGRRSLLPYNLRDDELLRGATVGSGNNISTFEWIDDRTIVYVVSRWDYYYVSLNRLRVHDRQLPEVMTFLTDAGMLLREIVHPLPQVRDKFIATLALSGQATPPDLYIVDLEHRSTQRIARNPGLIHRWFVDSAGNLIGGAETVLGRTFFRPFNQASGQFEEEPLELAEGSLVLGVSATGTHFIMGQYNEQGYRTAVPWSIASNRPAGQPFQLDGYDVRTEVVYDNLTHSPIGVRYDTDKPGVHWYDANLAQIFAELNEDSGGLVADFLGFGPDMESLILSAESDRQNPAIVQLDLSTGETRPLLLQYPSWPDQNFSPMKPISFEARDGQRIHGYLTRAMDSPAEGPAPTILKVHGGPGLRTTWRFDARTQFLSALGFNVLQINYRGSRGYGPTSDMPLIEIIEQAPLDLADGIRWAIEKGIAEAGSVGALGFSFGAYLVMELAATEPELLNSVAAWGGVYDWPRQYSRDARGFRRAWAPSIYLDFDEEQERFERASVVHKADQIKIPVYLFHGGSDRRVSPEQARIMRRALRQSGTNPQFEVSTWDVHGFPDEASRIRYFGSVGQFFKDHLLKAATAP